MATKKELLSSELVREIIRIRIDTLWNMLALRHSGRLPPADAEKATGDFDDKGGLFVPGGMIFQDWEGAPIEHRPLKNVEPESFRRAIRRSMRYDGAQLVYPDGIASRIKLGNSAFSKMASSILETKKEALRRRSALGERPPARIGSSDITRSYCPMYIPAPYGTRTLLSSDLSVCLTEPRMYFRQCVDYYNLRGNEAERLWNGVKAAQLPVQDTNGEILAPPFMITCHNTRYRDAILTGVTRLSGFGKFGEFATITLEVASGELLHEVESGRAQYSRDDLVAEFEGLQLTVVLRVYPRTNPGARLLKGVTTMLVSAEKDLALDLERITAEARKRYSV